jgi:hypothetical protein
LQAGRVIHNFLWISGKLLRRRNRNTPSRFDYAPPS